jgi:hypothetical protein
MFQTFIFTAMNNIIREPRMAGIRNRKLEYFLTMFGGMLATNYMVSNISGRSPYEFPWTFIPFTNTLFRSGLADKMFSRQPEVARVAREIGMTSDFPTRGLPMPFAFAEDGAKGMRDLWVHENPDALIGWGIKYAPSVFGVGGGVQYNRWYRSLKAIANEGDVLDSRGRVRYSFDISDPHEIRRALQGGPTRTKAYLQWRKDNELGSYMEKAMWRLESRLTEDGQPSMYPYDTQRQSPLQRGVRERPARGTDRVGRGQRERTR